MTASIRNSSVPPPDALSIFEKLRSTVSPSKILTIKEDIDRHLLQIQKLAQRDEMTPLDLAEAVAAGLHVLLAELESFDADQQSAILAASLYFISDDDEVPDMESILGLDDDAAIFNHVARLVGREDLEVEL